MKKISRVLYFLIVIELVVGGGGHLLAIGPVSVRMLLFGCGVLMSMLLFIRGERLRADYALLLGTFALTTGTAIVQGIMSASVLPSLIWQDVKPLLFISILPFFQFTIDSTLVSKTSRWIVAGGVSLAVLFILSLSLIHTDIIPFSTFYPFAISTGEFFFRGETTYFYKGFIFLCVSFLFVDLIRKGTIRVVLLMLFGVALLATVTRGLWLSLAATYAAFHFLHASKGKAILFLIVSVMIIGFGQKVVEIASAGVSTLQSPPAVDTDFKRPKTKLLGDRQYSDEGRITQVKEVLSAVTPLSVLIGHGFGMGTPSRPVHMEISYAEIFHKQGLMGIGWWLLLLVMLFKAYMKRPASPQRDAYFFSALMMYIQSLTNQYINNPIGLFVLILALVALDLPDETK